MCVRAPEQYFTIFYFCSISMMWLVRVAQSQIAKRVYIECSMLCPSIKFFLLVFNALLSDIQFFILYLFYFSDWLQIFLSIFWQQISIFCTKSFSNKLQCTNRSIQTRLYVFGLIMLCFGNAVYLHKRIYVEYVETENRFSI